jgi:hypothetical protein
MNEHEEVNAIINRLKMDVSAMREELSKLKRSEIQAREELKYHQQSAETVKEAAMKLSRAFDRLFTRTRQGVIQKLKGHGLSEIIVKEVEEIFPKEIQFPEARRISQPPESPQ